MLGRLEWFHGERWPRRKSGASSYTLTRLSLFLSFSFSLSLVSLGAVESERGQRGRGGRTWRLELLQWARTQAGCPWDEVTCMFAAQTGHLEMLKWAGPGRNYSSHLPTLVS